MARLPWSPSPHGPRDHRQGSVFAPVILLLVATAGPGGRALAGSSAEPAAGEAPAAERTWHTSLAPARAEAEKEGKLLFVDLFADWCGWCRVLDRRVFSQPVFDELAQRLVLVRLDVEDGAEGSRTQARYDATGLPTTLILEPSGALVGKVTGVAEPVRYVRDIERQIDAHRRSVRLYDRMLASAGAKEGAAEAPEIAPERILSLAEAFHKRWDGARAAALYRLLDERGWSNPRGEALLPFRMADALRMEGRYEEATRQAARARKLATGGEAAGGDDAALVEAIDLLGVQIVQEQGDCGERRKALESFLQRHPESVFHRRVESSLAALETGADGTGCS